MRTSDRARFVFPAFGLAALAAGYASMAGICAQPSQPVPNLYAKVGKLEALCHKGFPNVPNLPNLAAHMCVHASEGGRTRRRVYACAQPEKRLGRLGRLGRSRIGKAFNFPTYVRGWEQVGKRLGSWLAIGWHHG